MSDGETQWKTVQTLVTRVEALEATITQLRRALGGGSGGKTFGAVADDAELDSRFGDPQIQRDPSEKYWKGESWVNMQMSQCPADYLDAFAQYKEACAWMNEQKGDHAKAKYVAYDRKDAARARGWAKRIREGRVVQSGERPPAAVPKGGDEVPADYAAGFGSDDEIPF